nr:hypothetical protein [Methylophaga sp. SB9B]
MNKPLSNFAWVSPTKYERNIATQESKWIKISVISIALAFFALFLVMPLVAVFTEALRKGFEVYWLALSDSDALSAVRLTLLTALIAVPLNLVFGVAAAWQLPSLNSKVSSC